MHLSTQFCRKCPPALFLFGTITLACWLSAAAGSREAFADSTGSATVHFSNASAASKACKANNLSHIYVTVSKVTAHRSGKHAGWHTLAEPSPPVQLDLLAGSAPQSKEPPFSLDDCLLASMDSEDGLPPGKYQQLRVIVAANGSSPAPAENACAAPLSDATIYSCVELNDGSFHPLRIPSGSKTGIKIPSTKIAKGGLKIKHGQGVDVDIDINACRSIVVTGGGHGHHGGGKYKLKPVMQAGEVSLNPIVAGQVVVGTASGTTVTSGTTPVADADVWIEANPASYTGPSGPEQVASVVAQTSTDSNGDFVFCPVPSGSYQIVSSIAKMSTNPSDNTITTAVTVDDSGGPNGLTIPLVEASGPAAAMSAQFTAQNSKPVGTVDNISYGASQPFGTATDATIPLLSSTPADQQVTTQADGKASNTGGVDCPAACPANTDCACVAFAVPPDGPVTGDAPTGTYTLSSTVAYSVFGSAINATGPCNPKSRITADAASFSDSSPTLAFTACVP
jgi:hypothetical protein